MNKQIIRRTWKYFIEQKIAEIAKFIGWVILGLIGFFVVLIILSLLGRLGYHIVGETCSYDCEINHILVGMGITFLSMIIGLVWWEFFYELLYKEWLVPNWKEAKKRAQKELKKK